MVDSNAGESVPSPHSEVDPTVERAFWVSVLEANVALGALSLGVLFLTVAQWVVVGTVALIVGVAAGVGLYWRVRQRPTSEGTPVEATSGRLSGRENG